MHVLEQKAHLTKSCFGCRGTNWLPVLYYTYGIVVSNIALITIKFNKDFLMKIIYLIESLVL